MGKEQEKEEVLEQREHGVSEDSGPAPENDGDATVEEKLLAAQEEVALYRDKMLRAAAEFENYKKRMDREHSLALKYAGEHILRDILPVVDNLERALAQGVVAGVGAEKNLTALLEGVQLTLKSLVVTLEKFEVKPLDSVGQPFDPNVQEALTMEASDDVPASHVVAEFEKGYYYKDRLLRVAKVIVSAGKSGA